MRSPAGIPQLHQELMYEFHTKELTPNDALKQYADHTVEEIKSTYGWDTDVQINIEPAVKDKKLFSVSMNVFGPGQHIVIRKSGKHIMAVLRKVRKTIMRQIHKINEKRVSHRKKSALRTSTA